MRLCRAAGSAVLAVTALLSLFATPKVLAGEVKTNIFGERAYYHLALELTKNTLVETGRVIDPDLGYRFGEGGMFEIYLTPSALPKNVTASGCTAIKARMFWTNPTKPDAAERIAEKRALFQQIEALRRGESERVEVVLELNPYVEKTSEAELQLTQCVAFFRRAFGAYVPHDGPLADTR
ncbi:hypothetical protein HBA54_19370 [Pelagibius litoralis]|uniref:Uncharacterized protein n=1 Tax=Pelagibius litoralis TaxID=374515 RepID=A0A967F0E7_9PROT|nr:hypothetical protein [Pelagibius litoralis]NIA70764.1 hypothetical protein [Pelagibius litoralis]